MVVMFVGLIWWGRRAFSDYSYCRNPTGWEFFVPAWTLIGVFLGGGDSLSVGGGGGEEDGNGDGERWRRGRRQWRRRRWWRCRQEKRRKRKSDTRFKFARLTNLTQLTFDGLDAEDEDLEQFWGEISGCTSLISLYYTNMNLESCEEMLVTVNAPNLTSIAFQGCTIPNQTK